MKFLNRSLVLITFTIMIILASCHNEPNITLIDNLPEGFRLAQNQNKKVLLIVGAKGCGKCSKYIEYLSNTTAIRESIEKNFVLIYEKNTEENIAGKITNCIATPMPFIYTSDGDLLAFGFPKVEKEVFNNIKNLGMDKYQFQEFVGIPLEMEEYKKMISKCTKGYLSFINSKGNASDLNIAYELLLESIKIKPYCYNLHLANKIAKQLNKDKNECNNLIKTMKENIRPLDYYFYSDIIYKHLGLTEKEIKKVDKDKKGVHLSATRIKLGEVKKKSKKEFSFQISNTGTKPFIINTIRISCSCVDIEYPKKPILPNASSTITGVFESNHKGKFLRVLSIHTNSKQSPLRQVAIEGVVI